MKSSKLDLLIPLALAVSLACVGSVGCGARPASGASSASGAASTYAGPIRSSDVALGQSRYDSRCGNACHSSGGGPPLEGIAWSPERMRRQIREGGSHMPAIGATRLSDDDLEAVLAYLVTIGAIAPE